MSAATDRPHSWSVRATLHTDTEVVQLIVAGRLGSAGAAELRSALDAATSAGGRVHLDLAEVDYISSAGLAVLGEVSQRFREAGGVLEVIRPSEAVSLALRLADTHL
ncbi:MAG: STAS domain-containing protein [Vicinamibacterales bacterium]